MEGVRVISLGTNGDEKGKLKAAVASVTADTIIAHLPYPELLMPRSNLASGCLSASPTVTMSPDSSNFFAKSGSRIS